MVRVEEDDKARPAFLNVEERAKPPVGAIGPLHASQIGENDGDVTPIAAGSGEISDGALRLDKPVRCRQSTAPKILERAYEQVFEPVLLLLSCAAVV